MYNKYQKAFAMAQGVKSDFCLIPRIYTCAVAIARSYIYTQTQM